MVEEPLLKESKMSHEAQDAPAMISRSSLRGKVKQQTRRLSLALNVGGNNVDGGGGGGGGGGGVQGSSVGAAGVGGNGSPFYSCGDFADSARAGILRCGREDDEGKLLAAAATGDTSASTSDCHGSKDSIALR